MRVAAIYDVHANLPALEAVLPAIEESGVDLIVVGGDLAWGPLPRETMERAPPHARAPSSSAATPTGTWSRRWGWTRTRGEQLEFLAAQAESVTLEIDALGPVRFCHGSPRSDRDRITVGTPEEKALPMLARVEERTIVCGHTHAQFDRRFGEHRVVNPGSVGLQFGERGAYWAVLGPDVDLRHTHYDCDAAARRILARPGPVAAKFAERVIAPPPAHTAVERWGLAG